MPTYRYSCTDCGETFEIWRSIHAEKMRTHAGCGGRVTQILAIPMTYGIGERGAHTREVDARESRWDKDLPAYKRFRDKGLQPRGIDGCDQLEATAKGRWHVETGQPHTDDRINNAKDLARAIVAGEA